MKRLYILFILFSCLSFSQNNDFEQKIDSLFSQWNDNTKPGGAAGIIKDGKVIYLKGFGSANLKSNTLITPQSQFQLGELSKQFTSLAILILEAHGKISLQEDIRKYIPELPEYEHKVTLGHLLNHSSGLYDINRLQYMINGTMTITSQTEALKLISSQKVLSFKPGTDFSFHESVTESVLMAEIVSKASGQSFAEFVKSNIFEPLEMKNSQVRDDSNSILDHIAIPYQKGEGETYKTSEVRSSVVGAINVYSSAEDLTKWYLNYTNPQGEIGRLIQKLDTPVRLSNGEKFVYYWGEMAIGREFTHPERGLPIYWNYGFQGAYGSNIFRYPNQNITSFVLGNCNQYNGAPAQNAINIFVENLYPLPAEIDFKTKNIKTLSVKKLKAFEGHYWFKNGYASELFVKNDTLRAKWLFNDKTRYQTLVPLSDNEFQQYAKMEDQRRFKFKKEGDQMTLVFTYNESSPDIMERYNPVNPSEEALEAYTGTYYNNDYSLLFSFHLEDGQLVAKHLDHQDITFRPVKKDVFTSTSIFFNALTFIRDKSNGIEGFEINTDGIKKLAFKKA